MIAKFLRVSRCASRRGPRLGSKFPRQLAIGRPSGSASTPLDLLYARIRGNLLQGGSKMRAILLSLYLALPGVAIAADTQCAPFVDAAIVSSDGKYLGRLSGKYDSESVFNEYGTYGSKYQSESIWNKYGDYGSPYSTKSAFNPFTADGPKIVKNRKIIAVLTKNKYVSGAVDPVVLAIVCFDFAPD